MKIDDEEITFIRQDGTLANQSCVGVGGETETGEAMFFEIIDLISPILSGTQKYKRVVIRRVFPCIALPEHDQRVKGG